MPSSKSWSPKSINHQSISFKIRFLFHPEKKCNPWELLYLLLLVFFFMFYVTRGIFKKLQVISSEISVRNWLIGKISESLIQYWIFFFKVAKKHGKFSQNFKPHKTKSVPTPTPHFWRKGVQLNRKIIQLILGPPLFRRAI